MSELESAYDELDRLLSARAAGRYDDPAILAVQIERAWCRLNAAQEAEVRALQEQLDEGFEVSLDEMRRVLRQPSDDS